MLLRIILYLAISLMKFNIKLKELDSSNKL